MDDFQSDATGEQIISGSACTVLERGRIRKALIYRATIAEWMVIYQDDGKVTFQTSDWVRNHVTMIIG